RLRGISGRRSVGGRVAGLRRRGRRSGLRLRCVIRRGDAGGGGRGVTRGRSGLGQASQAAGDQPNEREDAQFRFHRFKLFRTLTWHLRDASFIADPSSSQGAKGAFLAQNASKRLEMAIPSKRCPALGQAAAFIGSAPAPSAPTAARGALTAGAPPAHCCPAAFLFYKSGSEAFSATAVAQRNLPPPRTPPDEAAGAPC